MKKIKEKFPRILISRDEEKIKEMQNEANWLQTSLQKLVDSFNIMNIGIIENVNDLQKAVLNPVGFYENCISSLVTAPVPQGPFKINKKTYLQSLELPDNSRFVMAAKLITSKLPHIKAPLSLFEFNKKGQIDICRVKYELLVDKYSVFAITENEIKSYKLLNAALKAMQDLSDFSESVYGLPMFTGMYKHEIDVKKFFKVDLSKVTPFIKINDNYIFDIKQKAL